MEEGFDVIEWEKKKQAEMELSSRKWTAEQRTEAETSYEEMLVTARAAFTRGDSDQEWPPEEEAAAWDSYEQMRKDTDPYTGFCA